jgi:hypothetical protein
MGANVFFAVRTALVYRPTVDRPQAQLVRELVDRIAGRVSGMNVNRFGPAVQEEKPADDRAESSHGLCAREQRIEYYYKSLSFGYHKSDLKIVYLNK